MKKFVMALTVLAASTSMAASSDYYQIANMKVTEVPVTADGNTTLDAAIGQGACGVKTLDTDILNPTKELDLVLDVILNMGKKIWNVVQQGRPVVNIKTDVATALPQGASCWTDLQTWSRPEVRQFRTAFTNGFGSEVVQLEYRVNFLPNGSVDGAGKYIGYATITPVHVNVSWGFEFNMGVTVPTVFNMGSKAEPLAGMQMNVDYSVDSVLSAIRQSQAYFMSGKGEFQALK